MYWAGIHNKATWLQQHQHAIPADLLHVQPAVSSSTFLVPSRLRIARLRIALVNFLRCFCGRFSGRQVESEVPYAHVDNTCLFLSWFDRGRCTYVMYLLFTWPSGKKTTRLEVISFGGNHSDRSVRTRTPRALLLCKTTTRKMYDIGLRYSTTSNITWDILGISLCITSWDRFFLADVDIVASSRGIVDLCLVPSPISNPSYWWRFRNRRGVHFTVRQGLFLLSQLATVFDMEARRVRLRRNCSRSEG